MNGEIGYLKYEKSNHVPVSLSVLVCGLTMKKKIDGINSGYRSSQIAFEKNIVFVNRGKSY